MQYTSWLPTGRRWIRKQLKRRKHAQKESLNLDAQGNTLCKPMLKGRVCQSHGYRGEAH
jgi:hypothetical protein